MVKIEGITFYTIEQTAKLLGVSSLTVRNYIKRGRLKGTRVGRPILITERDIKLFLKTPSFTYYEE
jgi:excisionase family DNA binding protein